MAVGVGIFNVGFAVRLEWMLLIARVRIEWPMRVWFNRRLVWI